MHDELESALDPLRRRRAGTGLRLRERIFRLSVIGGRHYFVLFGWPLVKLSRRSRYLRLRDLERRAARPAPKKPAAPKPRPPAPVPVPAPPPRVDYYLKEDNPSRLSTDELYAQLSGYDVVSFDIFDTAVFRCVARGVDVFRVLEARTAVAGFARMRRTAEAHARAANDRRTGSREVTLAEIYAVLAQRNGIGPEWAQREADLEIELCRPNPYLSEVFSRLVADGKTVVFLSDMYLPRHTLEAMLARCGYVGYQRVYVSNEHGARKGDGSLQRVLRRDYPEPTSIVHVGDVFEADVVKSQEAGLDAVFNPDQRGLVTEPDLGSLAGSVYRAVVTNALGCGTWDHDLHYTHGFRVGGILTVGFCEYLERLVSDQAIDKVLFCGRDCHVLAEAYRTHFGSAPSAYVDISRYAIFGVTLDRNFDEYVSRSFFRWLTESHSTAPISQLLADTGFDYLIPLLEEADLEKYLFPGAINRQLLEEFFWQHRDLIEEHNAASVEAASDYFAATVGDAQRVLIVDVGWSGSCVSALRHFLATRQPSAERTVLGALLCTSREERLSDAISAGWLFSYGYSPMENVDLAKALVPDGKRSVRETDRLHLPLEYLFTQDVATAVGYARDDDGRPVAVRGTNQPGNHDQIQAMRRGILDFVARYLDYSGSFAALRPVSSYVALRPLLASIAQQRYTYEVYKDFLYDGAPALLRPATQWERFGELFDLAAIGVESRQPAPSTGRLGKILFVTPELIYAGAPRSLLRMCTVAVELGYEPIVWTQRWGPFAAEFAARGFQISVVTPQDVSASRVAGLVADGVTLAVCNTVLTDAYVRAFEGRLPLIWFVREAANLPDFVRSAPERLQTVRTSRALCTVSEYAARELSVYTDHPIAVVRNSVPDVSYWAQPRRRSDGGKYRFVQLGTIEQRKGYDVLVAAFLGLPAAYRDRAELHFAGGFINSAASFASYVFGRIDGHPDIHFHGLITDEQQKIELLSQMDTVVVASRDESCSLVALEGAMLGKPLIVTTGVGAQYLVDDDNGLVVPVGDVAALRAALMTMLDRDDAALAAMGEASRDHYEQHAAMDVHRRELAALFAARIAAGVAVAPEVEAAATDAVVASSEGGTAVPTPDPVREVVVSLTSFPARIGTVHRVIASMLNQTRPADRIVVCLSADQFPGGRQELPPELLALVEERVELVWVDGDLGPHKKYLAAMRRYPQATVITVDDDAVYDERLIENLLEASDEQPHAVICERANLMLFRPDGTPRSYGSWVYDCGYLRGTPTYQLLATGLGGVLYPPGALPQMAFDEEAISRTCPMADDLWLKAMATANGYPTSMPRRSARFTPIPEAQTVTLWRHNSLGGGNDASLRRIIEHLDKSFGLGQAVIDRMRGVRADGAFVAWGDLDLSPLLQEAG